MKGLRKNLYTVAVIVLFAIAFAMLVLFLALFSSSTAVDGTTVGSVYIGDKKANSNERKQKLTDGVKDWQEGARYSISFQDYSLVIGRSETIDEKGNTVVKDVGLLEILDFDYDTTNRNIKNGRSDNDAAFTMSKDQENLLFQTIVDTFGEEVTDNRYFLFEALVKQIKKDATVQAVWRTVEVAAPDAASLVARKVGALAMQHELLQWNALALVTYICLYCGFHSPVQFFSPDKEACRLYLVEHDLTIRSVVYDRQHLYHLLIKHKAYIVYRSHEAEVVWDICPRLLRLLTCKSVKLICGDLIYHTEFCPLQLSAVLHTLIEHPVQFFLVLLVYL